MIAGRNRRMPALNLPPEQHRVGIRRRVISGLASHGPCPVSFLSASIERPGR